MDHVCLAVPVLPGKSADARAFFKQLDGARRQEFDASERKIGITKELWYLAPLPSGDLLIAYMESGDFNRALERALELAKSDEATHLPGWCGPAPEA